jgi:hypothetical protein
MKKLGKTGDLVNNFRDVRFGEPLGLPAKGDIEFALLVETNHPIEAASRQEQEIKGIAVFVETFTHVVVMFFPSFSKQLTFMFQKGSHGFGCYFPTLYCPIKCYDMGIDVSEQCPWRTYVHANNTRTHKWLDP